MDLANVIRSFFICLSQWWSIIGPAHLRWWSYLDRQQSYTLLYLKQYLHQCFKLKDLRALKYLLGIEVARLPQGLFLCQHKFALYILSESGMLGAEPIGFPIKQNHRVTSEFGSLITDTSRYRCLMWRLLYLTNTIPDLQYSVHIPS